MSLSYSLSKPFLHSFSLPKPSTLFLKTPTKNFLTFSYSSEQELLLSITQNNGKTSSLPSVRTYESDLCRLSLVGDVSFEQALTAAAADGGEAADEHIKADMDTMVVETVFPGSADERTTVSSRLFLPTREVKEKARKLRSTLPKDMLSSMTSKNILAMTFRQVVLQRIWSFELQLLSAGAERNMEDLENPREVPAIFTISSSDERVLSVLAEAVCMYALESTEMDFGEGTIGTASNSFLDWFQKPRRIASKDFSVIIYKMSEDELVKSAKMFSQNFEIKEFSTPIEIKRKYRRWMPLTYSKLGKIGGPEFITCATEYLPAYRLQVDVNKLKNVKFEGWKNAVENRWEVLLIHSQMVELADSLDMYYEDLYTLPNKQLSCGVVADISKLSKNKRSTSLWKKLVLTLVGGLFVVSISILAQLYRSRLYETRRSRSELFTEQSSKTECYQHQKLEESELESLCIAIVKKFKDAVAWPGDIETERDLGAWTGELPNYLRKLHNLNLHEEVSSTGSDTDTIYTGDAPDRVEMSNTVAPSSDQISTDMETSAQDIASYQVVLSSDGSLVGFQPTSRLAVNHWASNPLAKELYNARKLTLGLIEPGLKIQQPDKVILVELLMSVNPESWFALARPLRETS